jgi:hypothetical protein
MEALLPILGAILMFWFLSRLNHSGDDSPRTNARNNDAVPSEPNNGQRSAALLKDLEASKKAIDTTCVEANELNEKEQEGKSSEVEGETEEFIRSADRNFLMSFLRGEAEYRHQPRRMERFAFGEKIRLGDVVDFLLGCDRSKSLTGLSICCTNIIGSVDETRFVKGNDEICNYDLLSSVTYFNDEGELLPLTGENVTLSLTRNDGLPIVLFVRNHQMTPDVLYLRVYSMVGRTNANDDKHTWQSRNLAALDSTLLCCRASSNNLEDWWRFYQDMENRTIDNIRHGKPLKGLQYAVCEGMFGRVTTSDYIDCGNALRRQSKYYDAQRQYERAIYALDNPSENFKHGDSYGAINFRMVPCLVSTHDKPRAFHFMDIAYFFNSTILFDYIVVSADLADYRTMPLLEQHRDELEECEAKIIECTYQASLTKLRKVLTEDASFLTLGFILHHLLRVNSYNIVSMCVCCNGNDGYTYDVVYDRDKLWRYKFQNLLHDGNTVVLRYSRACYQCGDMDDDKSDHCHDNSIIIQVNAIEDSDLFRIDVAVPGFQNDPNIISDSYGKFSDYKSFVISSKPHEYDFSKSAEEIMTEVGSLYNKEMTHAVESMLGLYHVYLSLLVDFDTLSEDRKFMCLDAAAKIGSCYMELNLPEVANYFLDVGYESCNLNNMMEYINCLVETKDARAMSIVDKQLIMQIDAPDQIKSAWRAFLKRRKAYILIDWGQVAEAKEFLSTLLDDPLCKDYAKRELSWLSMKEKNQ